MKLLHLLVWIVELLAGLLLWLLGCLVVPVLYVLGQYHIRESRIYLGVHHLQWKPRWAYLWSNEEDGIDGPEGRIIYWSLWRNPVNNSRYVKPFGILIDPRRIKFVSNTNDVDEDRSGKKFVWSYVWQGVYAGLHARWIIGQRKVNFRIGWKLKPRDAFGVPPEDHRFYGVGTGLQLQWRKV